MTVLTKIVCHVLCGIVLVCAHAQAADAPPLWAQVNRITWGVTPQELRHAGELGWDAYLDAQLEPDSAATLPADVQMRIDALSISRIDSTRAYRAQVERQIEIRELPTEQRVEAARANRKTAATRLNEAGQRTAWRALYSPNQLHEVMTWFWLNHFSVYAPKGNIGTLVSDYEEHAIRPHALGKFRDLLRATARSPAMLLYLDNARNIKGRLNENYARELMELHTMGVDGGYSQRDVQELARVLTGLGVNASGKPLKLSAAQRGALVEDGLFQFNPARHDNGAKAILGHRIEPGGMDEIDAVLDILARHPSTARLISRKLAQYFVADRPSQALVNRMAQTFLESDGDIARTLRTMFDSAEFAASLRTGKFKDALQYVYSSFRLAYADMPPIRNVQPVLLQINRLGQGLARRITPDGYPMAQSDWAGSGQMTARFDAARVISSERGRLYIDTSDAPRPELPAASRLVDAYGREGGPFACLAPATLKAIEQAANVPDANALLLSSPEFMRR
ncbi:DUF1800 domain-containing protein [Bordetella genomosp. 13]|uniref:DUF1800 domain-containing protein n=1 Tax=Bordetella genomosp. 13 TaxID=463040 RepID=A0A1W6ZA35_9BORD|nr:DUF1800 domain-containing protein [Bordetella genomosp. 13]ARP94231.1 hypothetical protein CAL15_07465 [Bordetella genomosp. 13]